MAGQGCLCAILKIVGKCNVHECFLGIYCVNYVCIKGGYIMCGPVSWRRLSSIIINNPYENALTLYNTCAIIIIYNVIIIMGCMRYVHAQTCTCTCNLPPLVLKARHQSGSAFCMSV